MCLQLRRDGVACGRRRVARLMAVCGLTGRCKRRWKRTTLTTVREAARLHSYPGSFTFDPTRWHGFMQVGNSVPPKLAEAIGKALALVL